MHRSASVHLGYGYGWLHRERGYPPQKACRVAATKGIRFKKCVVWSPDPLSVQPVSLVPVIVACDPANSLLIKKQSGAQPHFAQLTPDELKLVTDWIEVGAPGK